jgi:capsular exopolysaccharide synthesis family protein
VALVGPPQSGEGFGGIVGKIFDALKKKADPIAEQVLNPSFIPAPAEAPLVLPTDAALDSALAAVLEGASVESKKTPAEMPAELPTVSVEGGAEPIRPAAGEMPAVTSAGPAPQVDRIAPDTVSARPPASQGVLPGSAANFRAEVMPENTAAINGSGFLAPLRILDVRTLPICVPGGDPLLPFDSNPSRASEQYRYLRTKLVQNPKQPRLILISSPGPGDGKTVTAVNLTGALSLKSSAAVVLVDADLRRASLHRHLGIPKSPGLVDLLRGKCALEEVLIHAEQFPNLFIVPAGESKENPAELLDSAAWSAISEKLRATFKYVVIDSPPVASVADYHLIEATCDGVVLVVRPDHTRRTLTMQAFETVPKEKSLGVVLNCTRDWFLRKYSHYDYAYDYLAVEGSAKDSKR